MSPLSTTVFLWSFVSFFYTTTSAVLSVYFWLCVYACEVLWNDRMHQSLMMMMMMSILSLIEDRGTARHFPLQLDYTYHNTLRANTPWICAVVIVGSKMEDHSICTTNMMTVKCVVPMCSFTLYVLSNLTVLHFLMQLVCVWLSAPCLLVNGEWPDHWEQFGVQCLPWGHVDRRKWGSNHSPSWVTAIPLVPTVKSLKIALNYCLIFLKTVQ